MYKTNGHSDWYDVNCCDLNAESKLYLILSNKYTLLTDKGGFSDSQLNNYST